MAFARWTGECDDDGGGGGGGGTIAEGMCFINTSILCVAQKRIAWLGCGCVCVCDDIVEYSPHF